MIRPVARPESAAPSGWKAELGFDFARSGGRTVPARRRHRGPLAMQRPFYPERDVCHVYALHPPGGVVGGDRLLFDVRAESGAHGLVTTPSAGKFYRTAGPAAVQEQRLAVAPGGALDWLPLETIVYPGADARLSTRVDLAGDAAFFGWEVICLGLPASNAPFDRGFFVQTLEIYRDGEPVLLERARFEGGSALLREPWGLCGHTVFGTLAGTVDDPALAERIRERAAREVRDERFSLTRFDGLTVCRVMGDNAFRVRGLLAAAWDAMRLERLGRAACPPRVWNT
ncbi:Urease accessory protein UreD [Pseudodesulfovibrio mercurii]|uniref:Urease accessory protein UreD n=1 Tax=Pseudodesulfovibrio mercurii TaxID=641491 RepID=F0JE30_9BACT|nr:urease accessory protein UreD [Pseudodesulfovibrio mercurii]EGB14639.1 Urease accessory protein UreD [Pseudodesulfovibrio mercurii]